MAWFWTAQISKVFKCQQSQSCLHQQRQTVDNHRLFTMCHTANVWVAQFRNEDVCKTWWRHQMETFSALLAFCAGNSPVNSPHKGQWRGALMFLLICAWIHGCANNCGAGNSRRHRAHYDVTVMNVNHSLRWNELSTPWLIIFSSSLRDAIIFQRHNTITPLYDFIDK